MSKRINSVCIGIQLHTKYPVCFIRICTAQQAKPMGMMRCVLLGPHNMCLCFIWCTDLKSILCSGRIYCTTYLKRSAQLVRVMYLDTYVQSGTRDEISPTHWTANRVNLILHQTPLLHRLLLRIRVTGKTHNTPSGIERVGCSLECGLLRRDRLIFCASTWSNVSTLYRRLLVLKLFLHVTVCLYLCKHIGT